MIIEYRRSRTLDGCVSHSLFHYQIDSNHYSGNMENADFEGNIEYLSHETLNAEDNNG